MMILAGFAGLVALAGRAVARTRTSKNRPASAPPNLLQTVPAAPKQLKSACTLVAPAPPPPTSSISAPLKPRTLTDLSWQEFELMVGELFRRQGYAVTLCAGDGADGGVDLRLCKDGQLTLVQCKHWKAYKVGVSTVRELFGVLAAEQAEGALLVTTGRFTPDAQAFAAGKPLTLIGGTRLQRLIRQHRHSDQGDLLDVASWSSAFARSANVTDPVCPFCRSAMVLRRAKQSGNPFWGCPTYPRCYGKRNVRPELVKA